MRGQKRGIAKQAPHDPVGYLRWSRHNSRKTRQSGEQQISTGTGAPRLCGRFLATAEAPRKLRTPVSQRLFG